MHPEKKIANAPLLSASRVDDHLFLFQISRVCYSVRKAENDDILMKITGHNLMVPVVSLVTLNSELQ